MSGLVTKHLGNIELKNGVLIDAVTLIDILAGVQSMFETLPDGATIVEDLHKMANGANLRSVSKKTRKHLIGDSSLVTRKGALRPEVAAVILSSYEKTQDGKPRLADPWKDTLANREVLRRAREWEKELLADGLATGFDEWRSWERN